MADKSSSDLISQARSDREELRVGINKLVYDFESRNPSFEVGEVRVIHEYSRVVGAVVTRVEVEAQLK